MRTSDMCGGFQSTSVVEKIEFLTPSILEPDACNKLTRFWQKIELSS